MGRAIFPVNRLFLCFHGNVRTFERMQYFAGSLNRYSTPFNRSEYRELRWTNLVLSQNINKYKQTHQHL